MNVARKMVDSRTAWIGKFPAGWSAVRLRDLAKIETGSMNTEDRDDDGIYPLYVRSATVEKSNRFTHEKEAILVPGEGLIGEIFHLARGKHAVHQRVYSIQTHVTVSIDFVRYCMISGFGFWAKSNSNTVTVESLRRPTFLNFETPVPPIEEQKSIASYLDHHVGLIDRERALIATKIGLLKDKRKALIFEVVTGKRTIVEAQALAEDGGGRLENVVFAGPWAAVPTPKMGGSLAKGGHLVDSGVEWIGEVPTGWKIVASKDALRFYTKRTSGHPVYIGMENVEAGTGKLLEGGDARTSEDGNDALFSKGQILFGKLRPYLRKVWMATFDGSCSTEFLVLTVHREIYADFAQLVLMSSEFCQEVNDGCKGVKMPRADWAGVGSVKIAIPPLSVQRNVVNFLTSATRIVDREIELLEHKSVLLSDKRNALIFEAVTGKLDLRNCPTS